MNNASGMADVGDKEIASGSPRSRVLSSREMMHLKSSRIRVVRKYTFMVNLPGSFKAIRECLKVILYILPCSVKMMHGPGH